ncbi:Suppressor of Sensor Kinase (SLN1) [Coemansia sp. RSA 2618]|nr:Suppressor of Sensor Kinase (SLN1) [Coemansia sp. RSA 2618]
MYMAPEVILGSSGGSMARVGAAGRAVEPLRPGRLGAQDVWALGCCIVEMITGSPPWSHLDNEWAIMYHVVSGDPPLPAAADISAEGLRFIRRCFTRQPADRPQAADLLRDEWLADTVRSMERLEARGHAAGKLASTPIDYTLGLGHLPADADSDAAVPSARLSHRSEHSVAASSAAPSPSRSRKSSIHTRNMSGDLRFMSSTASMSNAEVLLAMMDAPRSTSIGRLRAYSGSSAANNSVELLRPPSRTPGSPGSANSLHAAWPFNKPASTHGTPGAAASSSGSPAAASGGSEVLWNPLSSVDSEQLASTGSVATLGSPDPLSMTEEELVARYTSPSVIYQALSASATSPMRHSLSDQPSSTSGAAQPPSRLQHTSDMGSPTGSSSSVQSASVSQFIVETASDEGGGMSPPAGSGDEADASRAHSLPLDSSTQAQTGYLTTNDFRDLTATARMAVSALLRIPLEGADVAGVSGWLGEGNTPVELLSADEIQETVATTSQNIVRQREQQLRQKQEMHDVLRRRQFRDARMGKDADNDDDGGEAAVEALSDAPVTGSLPKSEIGVNSLNAQRAVALQMVEPPVLFPLPPVEDEGVDHNSGDDQ